MADDDRLTLYAQRTSVRRRPDTETVHERPKMRNERVTVRLPKRDVQTLDFLVQLGEFGNRSEAIRQAVRDLIVERADRVNELQDNLEKLQKLQNMAEAAEQVDEVLQR